MSLMTVTLRKAVSLGASDIHLKENEAPVFRVHGDLVNSDMPKLSADDLRCIVVDIVPDHLKRNKEAFEMDFSLEEEGLGRFRVNVFLAKHIPTLVFRHVKTEIPSFKDLSLPPILEKLSLCDTGIIIITGATGSGKSTTLASLVQCINLNLRSRIITIEDPVEYVFFDKQSVITQREVGLDTESFGTALKYVLRQDPDAIMIGEMRDHSSFRVALGAAETGHLVLSTLHATTTAQAVIRMLDFFPADEREQVRLALSTTLRAILCQRLIPAIRGGVVPAVEILVNTPTVRKLLVKNELDVLPAAVETGGEDGMQTFNQAIYKYIKDGAINEKEGLAQSPNPDALKMNLKGIFLDEGRRILGA
ncbi:MAG: PilT/PilU family type 4a pilus ATPase [Lentisphaerae bacterium]|nr:PilT/PilU family type 4a pilus ATPase [Lentisphaerota bacterium]